MNSKGHRDLPIFEIHDRLIAAAVNQRRLIITAPTGSGKSTQVPQMLLDAGLLEGGTRSGASAASASHDGAWPSTGQVVILQPRRIAARLLATWVAKQRGGRPGDEVGYQIRFEDVTSAATRIRYVTEGVLLRQMLSDPQLHGISAIIFDEFHERHLYGDITLARAVELQRTARPDLILAVMSATLDTGTLERYLTPCDVLSSAGRTHPVTIDHVPKSVDDIPIWEAAVRELSRLVQQHPEGDALVFMPGSYEINRTVQEARETLGQSFVVFPLHGELAPNDQDAAVARYDRRKVVVATNVAETSITIDGVRLVIDSGLARIPRYDPHRGINTLLVEKISHASADQRTGRAGRTAPGHCLRLWTKRDHDQRPRRELPEVKRLDLAEVVLTLKASGVTDVQSFHWLESPDPKSLDRAETLLLDLGALDFRSRQITEIGRQMLAFPLHPRYSRMLLAAQHYGCVRAIALIAALTQGRNLLTRVEGKQAAEAREDLLGGETQSDMFVLMRAWRYADRCGYNVDRCRRLGIHAQTARQVGPLFEQFLGIARSEGLDVSEKPVAAEAVQKCLLTGFTDHLAMRLDEGTLRCQLIHGRRGLLARDSSIQSPLLVAAEVAEIQGRELNVVLNQCTAIKEEWLRELFPGDFAETHAIVFDAAQRRVVCRHQKRFRDLVLDERQTDDPPEEEAADALAQEVLAGRCVLKHWDDSVEQWIQRVNCLRTWMPDLNLPAIGPDDRQTLLHHICLGAYSYKEIKDKPVWPVVKGWLSPQQQAWVNEYTPERLELPGGRRAKVTYSADAPPTISARIQDLYGVKEGLWVAQRRVPVRIEVLAPNHRPVQTTDNLANFWRETYPKLKQELQRKYPKHEWR